METILPEVHLPSKEEIQELDHKTIAEGIPSIELMQRAGKGIYQVITSEIEAAELADSQILILCGSGNNGGDGLTLAAELLKDGLEVIVLTVSAEKYSPDFLIQYQDLEKLIDKVYIYPDKHNIFTAKQVNDSELKNLVESSDIIVDALLGSGQKSQPRDAIKKILEVVDTSDAVKIAVDIPTGVDADNGSLFLEEAFSADLTVAIELIKRGMLQSPGRECCGKISVVEIELSEERDSEFRMTVPLLNFPEPRNYAQHKGDFGHVLVIGGSGKFPGAPWLAALAALRIGAGLVTKTSLRGAIMQYPEIMLAKLDTDAEFYQERHLEMLEQYLEKASVVLVGPGLGGNKDTAKFLKKLLKGIDLPLVLDADALNLIAEEKAEFSNAVMTPHPGEAARLLGMSVDEIQENRYAAVKMLHEKFNAVAILKGAGTVIYNENRGYVNITGNPYMATAGSGDVLAGVVAGLVAQGLTLEDAAVTGVAVHGLAGDLAVQSRGGAIIASDISDRLSKSLSELQSIDLHNTSKDLWLDSFVNHTLDY